MAISFNISFISSEERREEEWRAVRKARRVAEMAFLARAKEMAFSTPAPLQK